MRKVWLGVTSNIDWPESFVARGRVQKDQTLKDAFVRDCDMKIPAG
jgi:hypothetical protein